MLNELSMLWCDDYKHFLIITSICKSVNKFKVWDTWAKKSTHYNYNNNVKMWNNNKGLIDINYLNYILKKPKMHSYSSIPKLIS